MQSFRTGDTHGKPVVSGSRGGKGMADTKTNFGPIGLKGEVFKANVISTFTARSTYQYLPLHHNRLLIPLLTSLAQEFPPASLQGFIAHILRMPTVFTSQVS